MLRLLFLFLLTFGLVPVAAQPLLDWTDWQKHRATVEHPVLRFRSADIARARENIRRHEWARRYAQAIETEAARWSPRLTPEFLRQMIPDTTPISNLFTPCPACRDQKKPYLPHGNWQWDPDQPEQITCTVCRTVFPNDRYPETVILHSTWGRPQTFSWYGGETFQVFQWKHGRPTFTGNIRSQKVLFMMRLAWQLAEAWALTGKPEYADACRKVLVRFAEVYPYYLVHTAYGEIADMSPREAAFSMSRLPVPELTYPPNKPNRRLHTDFWTAGRLSGSGIEGTFIRTLAEAYDLTCTARSTNGTPLFPEADRERIERDLLLEGTLLAVADPGLNNKSVANRAAAGLVGVCVGHPELVRYGLEGFRLTVDDWFLPDGGTPESPAYGMMAISGVRDFALAFRDYSDPPGWRDAEGGRLDRFNLFRESSYPRVWQGFLNTLQGNLAFPPFADSRITTRFPPIDAEILASVYPEREEYSALRRELSRSDGSPADPAIAIYLRPADLEISATTATLRLVDNCMPDLRIGFMRTGDDGRESLLLLNASHWGIHHHSDSLNLYYWKSGHELLSDLGYLWDHPDKHMTSRTFAHNLVIVDEAEQERKEREGEVHFFRTSKHVKVMRASSNAYPTSASLYRRTAVLIDHGEGRSYAVDFFEVEGGTTQDYVYHGPAPGVREREITLNPFGGKIYDLVGVRTGETSSPWRLEWDLSGDMRFTAWNVPGPGEQVFVGEGWGQRDSYNRDRGSTIPYIVRRCRGGEERCFVSVFEGARPDEPFVRGVRRLPLSEGDDAEYRERAGSVILRIETPLGHDYIICRPGASAGATAIEDGITLPAGELAVVSVQGGKVAWSFSE